MPSEEIRKQIKDVFGKFVERFEGNLVGKVDIETLESWAAKKWVEKRVYGDRTHWQCWV